jgi:hypothetical protein
MTYSSGQAEETTLSQVEESHPGWHIWQLGPSYWAMRVSTATTIQANSLQELDKELSRRDAPTVESAP